MSKKLSLNDLSLEGKRVLMRVDFNVPLAADGKIADDARIIAALPSIRYVLDHGGSVVLMSHLGRPKNKTSREFSLEVIAKRLEELIQKPVLFIPDCLGESTEASIKALKPGSIALLENLRFYPAEEDPAKDPSFAKRLASYGDVYVNDAFGTAHRAHSSTATIAKFFPDKSAAGFLMQKEIDFLDQLFTTPIRPFFAVIGGSKISTKLGVLKALLQKIDALLIGGAMSYTFLKATGMDIGGSLVENDRLADALDILQAAKKAGVPIYLPIDHVIANRLKIDNEISVVTNQQGIPIEDAGMDIGPETIKLFSDVLSKGKTIFWNGPMGVFEVPKFSCGTEAIAKAIAESHAISVVGGGDSVLAISQLKMEDQFSHLSTGGGATLEWIEKGGLPGVDALERIG